MFSRSIRRFCTSVRPPVSRGRAIAGSLLAGGLGVGLYDYISRRNLDKVLDRFDEDLMWDEDWDRYVRVPSERYDEIRSWFIPPESEIVKKREKYDEDNEITKRTLVMVRHGQYETEGDRIGLLTALGRSQADQTGKRLAELMKTKTVRVIYHSSMPRARETAGIIAKYFPGIEMIETPLLAEGVPVEPNPPSSNCPPFEPEEGKRMEKAFRSFVSRPIGADNAAGKESIDLLIGHGNCFRFFICRALQIDPRFWLRMSIYNCGISQLVLFNDGRVSLKGAGDVGHQPAEMITYS